MNTNMKNNDELAKRLEKIASLVPNAGIDGYYLYIFPDVPERCTCRVCHLDVKSRRRKGLNAGALENRRMKRRSELDSGLSFLCPPEHIQTPNLR